MIIPSGQESNAEYHASGAWGSSRINSFIKDGPHVAWLQHTGQLPHEESTALLIGSALHARFDGSYDTEFAAGPSVSSRRTKTWQDAAKQTTKSLLLPSEVQVVDRMEHAVRSNPYASCLLEGAQREVGIRRQHESGLFALQCRMDLWLPGQFIADFKTTGSVSDFAKSVNTYGYHRQAALYRWLCAQETGQKLPFSFIVVEKQAPYRCRVIELDEHYSAIGHQDVQHALTAIEHHYRTGDWSDPGYQHLMPPAWLAQRAVDAVA